VVLELAIVPPRVSRSSLAPKTYSDADPTHKSALSPPNSHQPRPLPHAPPPLPPQWGTLQASLPAVGAALQGRDGGYVLQLGESRRVAVSEFK